MNTNLTRRGFGLAALSAPAVLATAGPVAAAAETKAAPVGGVFSASLGAYKITALFDGLVPLTTDFFFGVEHTAVKAVLDKTGQIGPALPVPVNAFLLTSSQRTILIDAGMGAIDILGPGLGQMSGALSAACVAPEDVDLIVLTHAHPDHAGGLVDASGVVFPNAEIAVSEVEHAFWTNDAIMAQADEGSRGLFAFAQSVFGAYGDRLTLVGNDAEVAPGLRLQLSPGHTPGHAVVHIDGGDREMLMIADTLHNPDLHTALPHIGFGFDVDTALAGQSRAALLDRAASDKILIAASHGHFPGLARIGRDGSAYRYVPASWM